MSEKDDDARLQLRDVFFAHAVIALGQHKAVEARGLPWLAEHAWWLADEMLLARLTAPLSARPRENANENAKSPARDTTGGAGGGDPLPKKPEQENAYWAVQMAKCWQETLDENTQLKADLARLSLVHQQLRDRFEILIRAIECQSMSHYVRDLKGALVKDDWVRLASDFRLSASEFPLAASTTETPP